MTPDMFDDDNETSAYESDIALITAKLKSMQFPASVDEGVSKMARAYAMFRVLVDDPDGDPHAWQQFLEEALRETFNRKEVV